MANKRGAAINGWVVLDKPAGISSTRAGAQVRALLGARKAGHAGTLDPFAEGLLPVALGEATKTVPYIVDAEKAYRFTLRWGTETDSGDPSGAVALSCPRRPRRAEIESVLSAFLGPQMQTPPVFSAIKVNGVRAYRAARNGAPVVPPPRPVIAHDLQLLDMPDADHAVFELCCGKGFYVRALARDLARRLQTAGHVSRLRRIRTGPFREADAIPLAELAQRAHKAARLADIPLPPEAALDGVPALFLREGEAARLYTGLPVSLLRKADLARIAPLQADGVAVAFAFGRAVGLVRYRRGEAVPVKMFTP